MLKYMNHKTYVFFDFDYRVDTEGIVKVAQAVTYTA